QIDGIGQGCRSTYDDDSKNCADNFNHVQTPLKKIPASVIPAMTGYCGSQFPSQTSFLQLVSIAMVAVAGRTVDTVDRVGAPRIVYHFTVSIDVVIRTRTPSPARRPSANLRNKGACTVPIPNGRTRRE